MELGWRDPGVEGSLDNRVIDFSPLSVIHRVGDVSPLYWSLHGLPQLASYPQAWLVVIIAPRLENGLRVYLGCITQANYDAIVLPHDY